MNADRPGNSGKTHANRDIYTISRLNREVRGVLEREFGAVWVEGELSNFARPRSGHWYFSLKDDSAQVRCAMFRSRNALVGFEPRDGAHVIARARVGMYEPRGEFQLVVEHLELAGEGILRIRFEELKRKLAADGLFDPDTKKALPAWPNRIGLITSPSGAAIRDILTVLERRNPAIEVVLYPVSVQGVNSAPEIVTALGTANSRNECDLLILARGGGSLEDLWSFNEESVARAIFASVIPVVSAVGHEIDFTITDLVADMRAATPSASAELCAPDRGETIRMLGKLELRLAQVARREYEGLRTRLQHLEARLQHPGRRIEQYHQRVDELLQRVPSGMATAMQLRHGALAALTARVTACSPGHRLQRYTDSVEHYLRRLQLALTADLASRRAALDENLRALRAVSPEATLQRGYSIVTAADGTIARDAGKFTRGDHVSAKLTHGRLALTVDDIEAGGDGPPAPDAGAR